MEKQTNNLNNLNNLNLDLIDENTILNMMKDLSIIEKIKYFNNELKESNINKNIKNIIKLYITTEILNTIPGEEKLNYIELLEFGEESENTITNTDTYTNIDILEDKFNKFNTNVTEETDELTKLTNLIEILENEFKPNINIKYKYKTTNIKRKYKNGLNYGFELDLFNKHFTDSSNILYIGIITDTNNNHNQTNLNDINNKLRYFGWSKERNTINTIDKIITHLKNCKIILELSKKRITLEQRIIPEIYNNKNIISKILLDSYEKTLKEYYKDYYNTEIINLIRKYIKRTLKLYKKYLEKQYNCKDIIFDLYHLCYISRFIIVDIIASEYFSDDIETNKQIIEDWYNEFERQLSKEEFSFIKNNMPTIIIQNIKTNEIKIFNDTKELKEYLNVSSKTIYNLIYGKTKSCKNWKLLRKT